MYGKVTFENIFEITEIYTAFSKTYKSQYSFVGEVHDFWELVIVTGGYLGVTVGNNVIVLKEGQAILHEPMEFHRLWSEKNSNPSILIITFNCRNMPELKSRLFEIAPHEIIEGKNIVTMLRKIFITSDVSLKGIKNPNTFDYQLAAKKLETFILGMISNHMTEIETPKSQTARNYTYIIQVLEDNIDKNLTVSEIAKLCNMSEINLKKTFFKYSHTGIKSYFNTLKMNEAIKMLKSGMTVTETALSLGFFDQNYFSSAFKRITGKTPSYYKKQEYHF